MSYERVIYSRNAQRLMREEGLDKDQVERVINDPGNRLEPANSTVVAKSEEGDSEIRVTYNVELREGTQEGTEGDAFVLATAKPEPFVPS